MNTFFTFVLGAMLSTTSSQRGLTSGSPVYLFASVSGDTSIADTATLCDAGTPGNSSLHRKLHNHALLCSKGLSFVAMCALAIQQPFKILSYPYHLVTADHVPDALGDLLSSTFYTWEMLAVRAVPRSSSPPVTSSLDSYTSNVAAVNCDSRRRL